MNIKQRVINEANRMLETKETIRGIAEYYKVSKSTVHKDLRERLKKYDLKKYNEVNIIMQEHLAERHIRGGEETKRKYQRRNG